MAAAVPGGPADETGTPPVAAGAGAPAAREAGSQAMAQAARHAAMRISQTLRQGQIGSRAHPVKAASVSPGL